MPWLEKEHSPALDMQYARLVQNGQLVKVMTADKTEYSAGEIKILYNLGGVDKTIHNIKKVFSGEIVDRPEPVRPKVTEFNPQIDLF